MTKWGEMRIWLLRHLVQQQRQSLELLDKDKDGASGSSLSSCLTPDKLLDRKRGFLIASFTGISSASPRVEGRASH